jgi:hypothetical protein
MTNRAALTLLVLFSAAAAAAQTAALRGRVIDQDRAAVIGVQVAVLLDGFTKVNLGALYNLSRLRALNVSNITDHFYYASTLGNTQFYPGEPRRVMFTVRVR